MYRCSKKFCTRIFPFSTLFPWCACTAIFAFGSRISKFFFLTCVQETVSMKILVLCARNSSRHRQYFVRGLCSLVVCMKSPHSHVAHSFGFLTQIGSLRSTTRQQRQRQKFCIVNEHKQKLSMPLTCFFLNFCTFLFLSRQICNVKWPFVIVGGSWIIGPRLFTILSVLVSMIYY